MDPVDLPALFEREFSRAPSSVEERAGTAAMGEEFPTGLQTYSFVSWSELRQTADAVRSIGGERVVDVGCGRGGPGVWVAGAVGARLTGIDVAESALARARGLAASAGVDALFQVGSFEATGLEDGAADAVMSFDAFLFTPDKARGLAELARVLRPGGRLVMTSWDYDEQPHNRPPQVDDHRPLADRAGFDVLSYEDTVDWRHRCTAFAEFMLEHAEEAAVEAGSTLEEMESALRDMRDSIDRMRRRFLMVADRRA